MIDQQDIGMPFSHTSTLSGSVLKWRLQMPAFIDWYYCKSYTNPDQDILLVARDEDDEFVKSVFLDLDTIQRGTRPVTKIPLECVNPYNFDSAVIVSKEYHGYLKGTFDSLRDKLHLCIPSYNCEFSGNESPEEFSFQFIYRLDRTLRRPVCPKIRYKIVNPTAGIDSGETWLFGDLPALNAIVLGTSGIRDAKVIVENYMRETLEVFSVIPSQFVISTKLGGLVRDRDSVLDLVDLFLKSGLVYLS